MTDIPNKVIDELKRPKPGTVFCQQCIHADYDHHQNTWCCQLNYTVKLTAMAKENIYTPCTNQNKHNDCAQFEQTEQTNEDSLAVAGSTLSWEPEQETPLTLWNRISNWWKLHGFVVAHFMLLTTLIIVLWIKL